MPSKSASQHRLMEAAAHTPGGYGGVPQSVGRDFADADKGRTFKAGSPKSAEEHTARVAARHGRKHAAAEFGISKSTVARRLRRGYDSHGSAKD